MDRARPPQARKGMVPLAVAATVLPAAPPRSRRCDAPFVSIGIALAVVAFSFALNSPLRKELGLQHEWAWGLIGFFGEIGGLMALLGMLFRHVGVAWAGVAMFFAIALSVSFEVWWGHLAAIALLGAVVAWQLRRQARLDEQAGRSGWVPA